MPELKECITRILRFRDERNWRQFHSPRNLAAAIAVESSELQEIMLWKADGEIQQMLESDEQRQRVSEELADILIFCFLFCDAANIDPISAIDSKLAVNAQRYPVELSRNRATKYTDL
jgi:dCTP diphosphatase